MAQPFISGWAFDDQQQPWQYQLGFQQNLNSYRWRTLFRYHRMVLGNIMLDFNESFNSSLLRLGRDNNKWRDDQKLNLQLLVPVSSRWGATLAASATSFADRLSGLVNDIKTNWASAGFYLVPFSRVKLSSSLGYKYDDRQIRIDTGPTYAISAVTEPIRIKEYDNQFYFMNKGDRFAVRKNSDFEFNYRVRKFFQQGTVDSLSIYWNKRRRDNYDRLDPLRIFVESLEEENRGFRHNLIYGGQNRIRFKFATSINSRQTSVAKYSNGDAIEYRSKKDFHSENEVGIIFQHSRLQLNVALRLDTDRQKNNVADSLKRKRFSKYFYYISPDYQSSRLTLLMQGNCHLFRSDSLQFNGAMSRYRYDTPENNMDDRDEFRLNLSITETHYFRPNLKLISRGSVNLYHLVYIFGERSANNNWMRIFGFFPQVYYQPTRKISISQQLGVLANYVVYDYETDVSASNRKSYVFRQFSLAHQVKAQITRRTHLFVNYKIELEENGKLDWSRWTEFLQTSRETHWLRMNINYQIRQHLVISPGILYLRRTEQQHQFVPYLLQLGRQKGKLSSFGPVLRLTYQPHQRLNVRFEGMRRLERIKSLPHRFINHFDVSLTWYH